MIGECYRESARGEALHLLCYLHAIDSVAHQRLVDLSWKRRHLGRSDLRQRLAVHAYQLHEGDEREARRRAPSATDVQDACLLVRRSIAA